MPTPSNQTLLEEYRSFYDSGEYYSALVRLAQLATLKNPLVDALLEELSAKRFGDRERTKAVEKAKGQAKKLLQILNFAGDMEDEELFQIVSIRIELGLFSDLVERKLGVNPNLPFSAIEDAIKEIRNQSPQLNRRFRSVIQTIRQNSGMELPGSSVDEHL